MIPTSSLITHSGLASIYYIINLLNCSLLPANYSSIQSDSLVLPNCAAKLYCAAHFRSQMTSPRISLCTFRASPAPQFKYRHCLSLSSFSSSTPTSSCTRTSFKMASTYATGLEPLPTKVPDTVSKHILELFSLKGKVASITGSSSGIGLEIARGFASVGADVAIWYHGNPSAIEKAKKISEEFGVRCKAYKCAIDNSKEV